MKHHMIVLAAVLSSCATSGAGPVPEPTRDLIEDTHGRVIRTTADHAAESTLLMGIDAAYAAVGVAYMRIGIEIATHDQNAHVLGNTRAPARGTLHGQSLSRYFTCGSDVTGAPLADSRRLTISAVSTLTVVDSVTTRMTTSVSGAAISSGTSTTPTYCSSTGLLERELLVEAMK